MTKASIGLLPLYLELYDRVLPGARPRMDAFYETIASEFRNRGLDVVASPVCRIRPEFDHAVDTFVEAGVDAIVTLHLAYSPSLESADVLSRVRLPIIVLDTTPAETYGPRQDPEELMYNHGIHGVQDLCNLLTRRGKSFRVEAGHWEKSDVLDRVATWAEAASLAAAMRNARVGLIGRPFEGMGDFAVSPDILRGAIGPQTVETDFAALAALLPAENDPKVEAEMEADRAVFLVQDLDAHAHLSTTRACLAVRRWMERERLTAFTFNFSQIKRSAGFPTAPFLEASKAMARGQGFAGEGDILTAALVGALASKYPDTTFTEMFCPDWENETVFLSHMGELNPRLADGKPVLLRKEMPWVEGESPVLAVGRLRGGEAVLANLAPGPNETFTLVLAPVEMLSVEGEDRMADSVRGWMRPKTPLKDFLADFSYLGGTHHSALVYGAETDDLLRFGELMGWRTALLG